MPSAEPEVIFIHRTTFETVRAAGVEIDEKEGLVLALLRWRHDGTQLIAYAIGVAPSEESDAGDNANASNAASPYRTPARSAAPWRVLTTIEMRRLRKTADGRALNAAYLEAARDGTLWRPDQDLGAGIRWRK